MHLPRAITEIEISNYTKWVNTATCIKRTNLQIKSKYKNGSINSLSNQKSNQKTTL